MEVILVAAIGENGEMGKNNQLLWHLPGDLPRFKKLTMGSPIIMGRKTFDSIGRPLPGRLNIVITANPDWQAADVMACSSIDEALSTAKEHDSDKAFIIGGGQIYKLFLAYATKLELTEVDDAPVADTFFPFFSSQDFKETARQTITDTKPTFDYVTYERS